MVTNDLRATTATPLRIARARGRVRGRLILLGPRSSPPWRTSMVAGSLPRGSAVSGQRHAPVRPFWFCASCVHPWPCEQAKASRDLTDLYRTAPDPVEHYRRFAGWVKQALAAHRPRDSGRVHWC